MKKFTFLSTLLFLSISLFAQDDDILLSADIMPSLQSCEPLLQSPDHKYCNNSTFLEFIYNNIKYPEEARTNNVQGGLQVEFIIDKNGKMQDIKVVFGLGSGCDEEVLRVLKLMNNQSQMWIAGENEGKAVSVRMWKFIFFKIPPSGMEMSAIKDQLIPEPTSIFFPSLPKGRATTSDNNDDNDNDDEGKDTFAVVDNMPCFPGCETLATNQERKNCTERQLLKYMYQNIVYPNAARENGVEGLVVAQFIIKADGSVDGLNIIKGLGSGCDMEVIRVLSTFNENDMKWKPGEQEGEAVPVRYNLPIRFKLAANEEVDKN